jgi:hypothetical protein
MSEREQKEFRENVRKFWKETNILALKTGLRFNQKTKQQTELRIEVLQELIKEKENEQPPDRKTSQFIN